MDPVDFYFDFISPYAWLALERGERFAAEHGVEFRLRPIVYAVLLNETGLIGPAEQPIKRRYTYVDVYRCARAAGLDFVGPPASSRSSNSSPAGTASLNTDHRPSSRAT